MIIQSIINMEKGLSFEERRNLELVRQVANLSPNILNEYENYKDLFDYYGEILRDSSSLGFIDSLKRSSECVKNIEKTKEFVGTLKAHTSDSFIIMPLFSSDHVFSAVIRRLGDEYSVTLVNKAFYKEIDLPYQEFIVRKEKIENVLGLLFPTREKLKTHDMYQVLKDNSNESVTLNIKSQKQKTNNCFIKEPEQAIQFAYATRGFISKDFKMLREGREAVIKWGKETGKIRQDLVNIAMRKYPKLAGILLIEMGNYYRNKRIRNLFNDVRERNGSISDYEDALIKAVNGSLVHDNKSREEILENCLLSVDYNTLKRYYKVIEKVLEKNFRKEIVDKCKDLKSFLNYSDISYYFEYKEEYKRLSETMRGAEKIFPWVVKHLNYDYHVGYINDAIMSHFYGDRKQAIGKYEKAIGFHYFNPIVHLSKGKCHYMNGQFGGNIDNNKKQILRTELLKALDDCNTAININPKYAEAYQMRDLCFKSLNRLDVDKSNSIKKEFS